MKNLLNRFVRDEQGQDLIEYALLAGFISLVAVVAITNVGTGVNNVYGNVNKPGRRDSGRLLEPRRGVGRHRRPPLRAGRSCGRRARRGRAGRTCSRDRRSS